MTRLSILLLFIPTAIQAQTISLPKQVTGVPCKFIAITATTEGQIVKWIVPPDGLDVLPRELTADPKTLVVVAQRTGTFKILAYTAVDNIPSDPAVCVLTIVGDNGPPPPIPDPPIPMPPDPKTEFEKQLAWALATDIGKDKLTKLIDIWKQGGEAVNNKDIVTTKELFAVIAGVEKSKMADADLVNTRRVIWEEVQRQLPENFILTTPQRATTQAVITKIVQTLEGL